MMVSEMAAHFRRAIHVHLVVDVQFSRTNVLTEAFTTDAFAHSGTHKRIYTDTFTQTLLHTRFCTQELLHTDALTHSGTHRRIYTDTFTQTLLHTNTFTHTLLHTRTFTHRRFDTRTLLHTDSLARKYFETQKRLHADCFTHRQTL